MQHLIEYPYGLDVWLSDGAPLALFDASGLRVANPTLQSGVRAARTLTASGAISDGETVTVVRRDGSSEVYTFKTALTPTAGEVLIAGSIDNAITNLGRAITGGGTPGTDYALGTEPCLDYAVTVDTGADTVLLTAINYGDAYNTAVGNFAETGTNLAWGSATSGVDTPDFKEALDYGTQANASAAPVARNGIFPLCPTADQLTCKRVHFEFDDDSAGGDFVRIDPVVLTTHHPAAGDPKGVLYAGRVLTATDLPASGAYIDVPANASHADYAAGTPWGGDFGPPETDNIVSRMWLEVFDPYLGTRDVAEIKSYDADGGASANEGRITFVVGADLSRFAGTLRTASRLYYRIYESNTGLVPELGAQAKADVNAQADTALATRFGTKISDTINDAGATTGGFTTTTDQGAKVLYGVVKLTSGALSGEARVAKWTSTTLTVLGDSDMDAAERLFSAGPANGVTFDFYVGGV